MLSGAGYDASVWVDGVHSEHGGLTEIKIKDKSKLIEKKQKKDKRMHLQSEESANSFAAGFVFVLNNCKADDNNTFKWIIITARVFCSCCWFFALHCNEMEEGGMKNKYYFPCFVVSSLF